MGGQFSKWNEELKQKGNQRRIDEMMREKGIHFPGPNEDLTEVKDFDNAGDAMMWISKLTPKQLKQVKDIPFKINGRRALSINQRVNLNPMSPDSIEVLKTGGAIQEVFRVIKNPEGITEWVAKKGGRVASKPAPMIGCQCRSRGGF